MAESTDIDALNARDGSEEAFARLYERLSPALAAWCRIRCGGAAGRAVDPDDLFQEIWWRALEAFPRFDAERGGFRPWVFGIAANTFRQLVRRAPSRRASRSSGSGGPVELPADLQARLTSITADLRRKDRVGALAHLVATFDEDDRRLFIHCGLEGMRLLEVAGLLGITENATKKRWQKLRRRLAEVPLITEFIEAA